MKSLLALALLVMVNLLAGNAFAVMPDEVLADPALEARARNLSQDLRCLVCQNQSIDDSSAPLAKDLRVIVRERLTAGDTDEQVIDYLVARYGNYVLLKPPFQGVTLFLWIGPAVFLIAAAGICALYFRARKRNEDEIVVPLTEHERRQLAEIVKDS
jgi:cytochrome c-type biogenesis protein CcmH